MDLEAPNRRKQVTMKVPCAQVFKARNSYSWHFTCVLHSCIEREDFE